MKFASYIFLFYFLPACLLLYATVPLLVKDGVRRTRVRNLVLALASYVFYGWARPSLLWLILLSTVVDFFCGRAIGTARDKGRKGRPFLLLSLLTNLGLLGYFKYANFFVREFNDLAASLGIEGVENWSHVWLPVGISFYTFQTMSYTIDVYRGVVKPLGYDRITDFMCYVAMFPQLVAGPIVRYKEVESQLNGRTHSLNKFYQGTLLLQCGLIKKLLIADMLHEVSMQAFNGDVLSMGESWVGALAFTFQLYFDFSGYSDMAIGLGLMMGFRFPINFRGPYRSISITDFWRRWHISLSAWLRDYLYIPLGGNKKGPRRTMINLLLTMVLGGLWHGAEWTFLAWGAYHGALLAIERWNGRKPFYSTLPKVMAIGITFLLAVIGWVFFKSPDVTSAWQYLGNMVGIGCAEGSRLPLDNALVITALIAGALVCWFCPTSQKLSVKDPLWWAIALQPLFIFAICELFNRSHIPFLYFRF